MSIEDLDHPDEVGERASKPVDFVNDHYIHRALADIRQQALQPRALHGPAGDSTVVIGGPSKTPALAVLTFDERLAGFTLRVQGIEVWPSAIACQEGGAMELRVHPKMKWEGYSSWPPSWGGAYGRGDIFPVGEEGVLKSVAIREGDDTMPIHLELTVKDSGKTASGILCCDDAVVIPRLYEVFSKCIGESIRKIGDLEVDL